MGRLEGMEPLIHPYTALSPSKYEKWNERFREGSFEKQDPKGGTVTVHFRRMSPPACSPRGGGCQPRHRRCDEFHTSGRASRRRRNPDPTSDGGKLVVRHCGHSLVAHRGSNRRRRASRGRVTKKCKLCVKAPRNTYPDCSMVACCTDVSIATRIVNSAHRTANRCKKKDYPTCSEVACCTELSLSCGRLNVVRSNGAHQRSRKKTHCCNNISASRGHHMYIDRSNDNNHSNCNTVARYKSVSPLRSIRQRNVHESHATTHSNCSTVTLYSTDDVSISGNFQKKLYRSRRTKYSKCNKVNCYSSLHRSMKPHRNTACRNHDKISSKCKKNSCYRDESSQRITLNRPHRKDDMRHPSCSNFEMYMTVPGYHQDFKSTTRRKSIKACEGNQKREGFHVNKDHGSNSEYLKDVSDYLFDNVSQKSNSTDSSSIVDAHRNKKTKNNCRFLEYQGQHLRNDFPTHKSLHCYRKSRGVEDPDGNCLTSSKYQRFDESEKCLEIVHSKSQREEKLPEAQRFIDHDVAGRSVQTHTSCDASAKKRALLPPNPGSESSLDRYFPKAKNEAPSKESHRVHSHRLRANSVNRKRSSCSTNQIKKPPPGHLRLRLLDHDGFDTLFQMKFCMSMRCLKKAYSKVTHINTNTLRFLFDGQIVPDRVTPFDLGLEDEDIIEVYTHQCGGSMERLKNGYSSRKACTFQRKAPPAPPSKDKSGNEYSLLKK